MKSVILAGGSGTHLWPLSREKYPKQFLKLGSFSLFQQSFLRALQISNPKDIFVVTNEDLKFYVKGQIQELEHSISWENILIEPVAKNTLPAIGYAIKTITDQFDKAVIAVFPSDHIINDQALEIIKNSEQLALKGYIVTFGIKALSANTNYGYIKGSTVIDIGNKIDQFIEKPEEESAIEYMNKGFMWNSGIFVFQTDTFFSELKTHAPDVFSVFNQYDDIKKVYDNLFPTSFDCAILEKTKKGVVVPLDVDWEDLDDFSDLYDLSSKDNNGNVIFNSELITKDSTNDLIYGQDKKLISLIDIHDFIIVDSSDVLLITSKKHSGKVKEIFDNLKRKNDERALTGQTVYRPWGWYTILEASPRHLIKKIRVFAGHEISHQLHYHRSEHWVVVTGTAKVRINGEDFFVRPGESTFIRAGEKHRLKNPSDSIPLDIIEVQLGEYISEDDIVRFKDKYGRK